MANSTTANLNSSSSSSGLTDSSPSKTQGSSSSLVAVTISRFSASWHIPEIDWFNFTGDETVPVLQEGGIEGPRAKEYQKTWSKTSTRPERYITYLAKKRNRAVTLALEKYPDATDVLMCDSYYAQQTEPLKKLIDDYEQVKKIGAVAALGGAAWGKVRTRISHYLHGVEWYDKWGVPDLTFTPYGWTPENDRILGNILRPPLPGLFHTSSLTGVAIWPRSIWDKGARFGVFEDLHGCEHNYFFEHSGIPRYTDLNAVFWRNMTYPFIKCLRCSLNLGRFIPKQRLYRVENFDKEYETVKQYKT